MSEQTITTAAVDQVFHALGDPTRRALLEQLSIAPASVSALAEPRGISLAAVVQQLKILEQSGLVVSRKSGRVRLCSINPSGLRQAEQWITARRASWEQRLDRLGDLLAEPDH